MTIKSTLRRSGFIKPLSGFYDGEKMVVWTSMDFLFEKTGEDKVYTEKNHHRSLNVLFWKLFRDYTWTKYWLPF